MSTKNSYVKELLARLKGDDQEALAIRIGRKAESAIKGQISSLESAIVDGEDKVEEAEEALNTVLYPETFPGGAQFINQIAEAQNKVEAAKSNLEDLRDSLDFFKKLLQEKFLTSVD